MKKKIDFSMLILFCIIAAFIGKVVRYTIMENVLVNNGIGWSYLKYLDNHNTHFGLTITNSNTSDIVNASDNSVFFFDKINFFDIKDYYQFEIYISIIFNIIIFYLIYKYKKKYTTGESLFIIMSVAVLNIFSFCLAKEPVQMLFFIILFCILKSKRSDNDKFIKCLLVFLLSALFFRNYYLIMIYYMFIIYYFIKWYLLRKNKIHNIHIIILLLLLLFSYLVLLYVAKFIDADSFNELLRVRQRTSLSKTDIRSLFASSNLFLFSLNYLITILRMLFPIELLLFGPKYFIYVFYQIIITIVIIRIIKNIHIVDSTYRIAFIIFFSFVLGSAAFEPDFGSWIRHESVLFPILIYLIQPIYKKESVIKC